MNESDEATLIERATRHLEALGVTVTPRKASRGTAASHPDAWLRLGQGGVSADYRVETRRSVTPATLGATLAQLHDRAAIAGHPSLLVTDYVTPQVAEQLRAGQQPFADAAGNVYLQAPGLLVFVIGRKPPAAEVRRPTGNTFTATGLKVLFALLCDPALAAAPQRAIAASAGVALGAVPGVIRDLLEAGHLRTAGRKRRLDASKRLLDEWALAYARVLRPKTRFAEFSASTLDAWRDWRIDLDQALWGGEPAANLLVGEPAPAVLTLYHDKMPPRLVIEQRIARARLPDAPPNLELRRPFWGKALKSAAPGHCAPPVLVYADLLAAGDARRLDAARLVYEQHIASLLPPA